MVWKRALMSAGVVFAAAAASAEEPSAEFRASIGTTSEELRLRHFQFSSMSEATAGHGHGHAQDDDDDDKGHGPSFGFSFTQFEGSAPGAPLHGHEDHDEEGGGHDHADADTHADEDHFDEDEASAAITAQAKIPNQKFWIDRPALHYSQHLSKGWEIEAWAGASFFKNYTEAKTSATGAWGLEFEYESDAVELELGAERTLLAEEMVLWSDLADPRPTIHLTQELEVGFLDRWVFEDELRYSTISDGNERTVFEGFLGFALTEEPAVVRVGPFIEYVTFKERSEHYESPEREVNYGPAVALDWEIADRVGLDLEVEVGRNEEDDEEPAAMAGGHFGLKWTEPKILVLEIFGEAERIFRPSEPRLRQVIGASLIINF